MLFSIPQERIKGSVLNDTTKKGKSWQIVKWDDPDGGNSGGNSPTVSNKSLLRSTKCDDVLVAGAATDTWKGLTDEGKTVHQWLLDMTRGRLVYFDEV
jgi:hypothetical protein